VRYVVRFGASKGSSETALKVALGERSHTLGGTVITRETRVEDLAAAWLEEVDADDLSLTTKARYRTVAETIVTRGLGQLRLSEVTVPVVDRFIRATQGNHGAATAKAARTVLSGMIGSAMRHGAITTNPTRDLKPIKSAGKPRARALTDAEQTQLLEGLRGDELAVTYDLVDLVQFMLGTGVRIGEACALREPYVDASGGTIEIAATVTDFGIEERPKTRAGWRVIAVPPQIIDLVARRIANPKIATRTVIFPSPLGRVRNRSNTAADLRRALDRVGFEWVSSHTFRKTVITRLDDAGLSARMIADHVGHARPSMTQDTYMGRNVASSAAAVILSAGISGH
jgi:integrase